MGRRSDPATRRHSTPKRRFNNQEANNMVATGSITFNGVSDQELVQLLEVKIRHEASFSLTSSMPTSRSGQNALYNGVTFSWMGEDGLVAVQEVLSTLLGAEAKAKT